MSSCCVSSSEIRGMDKFFSKHAKRYMKRFRRRGLAKEQRYLLEGILASPIAGQSIMEIGCGVGSLHMSLLRRGAASAFGIEIAEGMLAGAQQLSRELGFERNTRYLLADFATTDEDIPTSDIVILDKVVCCYEDLDQLLAKSLGKTRRIYALSFPRPSTLIKLSFIIPIYIAKLFRWPFHPHWHDWETMLSCIRKNHFKEVYRNNTITWAIRVFARESVP